jgi:hypothetical protein
MCLGLFKLDENTGTIFRVEKHDRLAVSADARFGRKASNVLRF